MASRKQVNSFVITKWAWQNLSPTCREALLSGQWRTKDYIGETVQDIAGMRGNRRIGLILRAEVADRLSTGSWA